MWASSKRKLKWWWWLWWWLLRLWVRRRQAGAAGTGGGGGGWLSPAAAVGRRHSIASSPLSVSPTSPVAVVASGCNKKGRCLSVFDVVVVVDC
ncbi:hypothetical protein DFJ73DRAFT_851369 [Zopfochytrium polystomum]|nr:hypothetical protein DFJ73DRAFT_851369 [Zopfochytrium polystomum]